MEKLLGIQTSEREKGAYPGSYGRYSMESKKVYDQETSVPLWAYLTISLALWQWDTELQARQGLVIEDVLFWGTLLKIYVIGIMSTPITSLIVRPTIGSFLIQHPGVTTVKWLQICAALTFLSNLPSLKE